jgi:hypothetical protein
VSPPPGDNRSNKCRPRGGDLSIERATLEEWDRVRGYLFLQKGIAYPVNVGDRYAVRVVANHSIYRAVTATRCSQEVRRARFLI